MTKIPLCCGCTHNCILKSEIENGIKIKTNEYCDYFLEVVNSEKYIEKCKGYKKGNTQEKIVNENTFKKIVERSENNTIDII